MQFDPTIPGYRVIAAPWTKQPVFGGIDWAQGCGPEAQGAEEPSHTCLVHDCDAPATTGGPGKPYCEEHKDLAWPTVDAYNEFTELSNKLRSISQGDRFNDVILTALRFLMFDWQARNLDVKRAAIREDVAKNAESADEAGDTDAAEEALGNPSISAVGNWLLEQQRKHIALDPDAEFRVGIRAKKLRNLDTLAGVRVIGLAGSVPADAVAALYVKDSTTAGNFARRAILTRNDVDRFEPGDSNEQ